MRGEAPTRSFFDLPTGGVLFFSYVGGKRQGRQQSLSPRGKGRAVTNIVCIKMKKTSQVNYAISPQLRGRLKSTTYFVAITQTSFQHTSSTPNNDSPPCNCQPLDERRGTDEKRLTGGVLFHTSEGSDEEGNKAYRQGRAVTSAPPFGLSLNTSYLVLFKRPLTAQP